MSCSRCLDVLVAFQDFSISNHDLVGPFALNPTLEHSTNFTGFILLCQEAPVENLIRKLPHLLECH